MATSNVPMHAVFPAQTPPMKRSLLRRLIMFVGPVALIALVLIGTYYAFPAPQVVETLPEKPADGLVHLTTEKMAAIKLKTAVAQPRELQPLRTVPGRVIYNELRWVRLNAPVEAVVQQVLVKPGDVVQAGTQLAVLRSSDVGTARSDVERKEADLKLAEQSEQWETEVARHLQELITALRKHPAPQEAEQAFETRTLGTHRVEVLGTYARLIEAEALIKNLDSLVQSGTLSSKLARERETNREVAQAQFSGACEQAAYDAKQSRMKAQAELEEARRSLSISRQRLRTLLGAYSELVTGSSGARDSNVSPSPARQSEDLSLFSIISPIAGTVEARHATNTQRVSAEAALFEVANTRQFWISADLRERDWQGLAVQPGLELRVELPALGNKVVTAEVDHVGRRVSTETHAVPLIATVDNPDGSIKPGMFAWIQVPAGDLRESLAIPASAVITHERRQFVFVQTEPGTFKRVDVTLDIETPDWVGVQSGLQAGDVVLTEGTFAVKSELLLEPED